jgi:hypothetical protein
MRTKTLLITAAAALAAGVITSQAQVYSQNIVGYVNTVTAAGGTFLVAVPFSIGVSNGANEIWPLVGGVPSIPDYSTILVWTGNNYNTYVSDSTSPSLWDDANFVPLAGAPVLPVGKGFFLEPSASTTNTFVGTVAVAVGATNNTSLAAGGTFLVAPVVPYGGALTNGTAIGGGINLWSPNGTTGLPDYSTILVWTGNNYNTYVSDSTSPSYWDDANFVPLATPPSLNVGQGFFLEPSATFTWTEGLSAQ